ncbi:hypothetical protein F2P56_030144 [Juglans regia]|uniref:Uncharacterized protein n=2 Tax=Juglans regia TaxID=51240 RepID=A0A833U0L6_JUGRE|nr:uncharacterized protein LOC108981967 [Juglans regia]KAF5449727.1 hypothetical protein F2P56_030144 [Juglans regia]
MDLLKKGLVWRVGNGESIKIWGDRWIPQLSSYKIQSPIKCFTEVDMVAMLIDGEKSEWKVEVVKKVFNEVEAEIICGLPVSKTGRSNKQIWAPSKSGVFNVKSAYHFEMQMRRSGCLVEGSSPVQKWPSEEVDFGFVWRKMTQFLSMEELELTAIVLRNIWSRRNKFIFESCFNSPANIFEQAEMSKAEYMVANSAECPGRNLAEREEVRWRKPREGVTKLNWDAAFLKDSKRMGAGVVFRDQEWDILLSAFIP